MSTVRQCCANVQNAQRSTGPRSEEGKAVSSRNAVTHGLFSSQLVVREGEQSVLDGLREQVWDEYEPCGLVEELAAEQVVEAIWRLRTCLRLESEILAEPPEMERRRALGGKLLSLNEQIVESLGEFLARCVGKDPGGDDSIQMRATALNAAGQMVASHMDWMQGALGAWPSASQERMLERLWRMQGSLRARLKGLMDCLEGVRQDRQDGPEEDADDAPAQAAEPAQPAPSTTAQPKSSTTARPAPSTTAQPAPSDTARPAPSTTAQPAPAATPGRKDKLAEIAAVRARTQAQIDEVITRMLRLPTAKQSFGQNEPNGTLGKLEKLVSDSLLPQPRRQGQA